MKYSFIKISLVTIIATATLWQCIGAWQDSQTTDEAVHLVSGLSYWQTGNFELNPEHPALFKLWASLPLVFLPQTKIPPFIATWQARNEWTIAAQYLHYSPTQRLYGSRLLMFLGRLPMIALWLALVLVVAIWTWKQWGPWAAVTTTSLLAYDPNFLGHGHLVTNDVAVAFAYLGTFLWLRRTIKAPNWKNVLILSIIFAVAQLTKFSAVALWIFVPIVMIVALFYHRTNWHWRWTWRTMVAIVVMCLMTTWVVYGFRFDQISKDPHIAELWQIEQQLVDNNQINTVPPLIRTIVRLTNPKTFTGQAMLRLQHISIPSYWYWRGFFSAQYHNLAGHEAYLMNRISDVGWWYYFPIALAIKTPIPLLLAVVTGVGIFLMTTIKRMRRHQPPILPFDFWFIGFPPLAFLAISMASHVNIGVRHVFPTYVFFPLAGGALVAYAQSHYKRVTVLVASGLVVSSILIGTMAWPNTIGYFNGLIGGTAQGHRLLGDSNLDWNQDFWRLRAWLDRRHFTDVHLAMFGSIPSNLYFPEATRVLTDQEIQAGIKPHGIIAISSNMLYIFDTPYHWLRSIQPTWRVGSSINVFDFR